MERRGAYTNEQLLNRLRRRFKIMPPHAFHHVMDRLKATRALEDAIVDRCILPEDPHSVREVAKDHRWDPSGARRIERGLYVRLLAFLMWVERREAAQEKEST